MEVNQRNIKVWSTIGPRATLGIAALDLAKKINNLMVLTCDVSTSAGLDRYRKLFPEKYIDLGIAEQNMLGVAAGLASENFNVVTTTFAPFQTLRCCEQIKVNLGYMNSKVCMVGIASGLVLGTLGFTHCCIEDVGILRTVPGITIISPADSLETFKALEAAIKLNQPTYIRLTGGSNNPIVNSKDYEFKIGKSIKLKDGSDITIFSTGASVYESLKAAEKLEEEKISCEVINMHTIKPLDTDAVKKSLNKKLLVSIEEHNIIGGLGTALSENLINQNTIPRLLIWGIEDTYVLTGSYNDILLKAGLTIEKITSNLRKEYNKL